MARKDSQTGRPQRIAKFAPLRKKLYTKKSLLLSLQRKRETLEILAKKPKKTFKPARINATT